MSKSATGTDRDAWIQLVVRLIGGAILIYMASSEIGPWTTVVLVMLLLGVEGNSFIIQKLLNLARTARGR